MNKKKVCIIGLGYIGLPTAALLANCGYEVLGVDTDSKVVETINAGNIHIVEPDLDKFVRLGVESGCLKSFSEVQEADVYVICVPTPFHEGGDIPQPNIDYIVDAVSGIARQVKAGDMIILESTSPVGTTEIIGSLLEKAAVDVSEIHIAYCPERVLPGKIMLELKENDRIVGGLTPESSRVVSNFYRDFVTGNVFETDSKTAELCKLTENSFRDVNIAFANELSLLCEKEGIDVNQLIQLVNYHPSVNVLQPGTGVGGHCIAVDPWFLVARYPDDARLIHTARKVNIHKTSWVVEKIRSAAFDFSTNIGKKPKIACLGLAYKADIDDLREAPAVEVVRQLISQDYEVYCVEPNISSHNEFRLLDIYTAISECDVIAILVNHQDFSHGDIVERLKIVKALDFCGTLTPS